MGAPSFREEDQSVTEPTNLLQNAVSQNGVFNTRPRSEHNMGRVWMRLDDGTLHLPTNTSPPRTGPPPPPRSPPPSAGPEIKGHLPRPYRFPVRPSTSHHDRAASLPMGNATVTERVRVDVRLAAGPSARRGQGPECLGRVALLGAARRPGQAQALHLTAPTDLRPRSPLASRNTFQQRNLLVASSSLPALPHPPLMPAPDAPRPLEGRFAAGSRAQLGRLAAAGLRRLLNGLEVRVAPAASARDPDYPRCGSVPPRSY